MQCHKCEWNGRLAEFADRPWDEVPCSRCEYNPDAQTRYVLPVDEDVLADPKGGMIGEGDDAHEHDAPGYGTMRTSSFASRKSERPPGYRLNDQSAPCPIPASLIGGLTPDGRSKCALPVCASLDGDCGERLEGRALRPAPASLDGGHGLGDPGHRTQDAGGCRDYGMPGPEVMDALGRVVDLLLRLTTKQYVVLRMRMEGRLFREIGAELGISGNAAEKVLGYLLRARPLLRSLFPRRVVRGGRRREVIATAEKSQ